MNAREIIERLAALDEAPVAEPETAPDIAEPEVEPSAPPAPSRPSREPSPDPWTVPPDYEPGEFPHPKAGDDTEAIQSWLDATQQPIQDWEWDGQMLKLLMLDGSVESYTREQLDEIGVLGQMAFAEGLEDFKGESDDDEPKGEADDAEPKGEDDDAPECPSEGADGPPGGEDIIGGILGTAAPGPDVEVVQGGPAEKLTQAVDDVVQAILGVVSQVAAGAPVDGEVEGEPSSGELAIAEPDERPDENYCPHALAKGVEVEKEHTEDEDEAKKIAKDHLDEDPEYYEKLEQVEGNKPPAE